MHQHNTNPVEATRQVWLKRQLIYSLTQREIAARYKGSSLGLIWSFLNPLVLLVVYTFVFSVVFKARWNAQSDSKTEFALLLFAGLFSFGIFAEVLTKAPTLVTANANYVKKIVFPLEILSITSVASALFSAFVSAIVWLLAYVVLFGAPKLTLLLLPIMLLPLCFFALGTSWFLSSFGAYVRDIGQFISVLSTILMFISPIFYPISSIPPEFRLIMELNPLTQPIENVRLVMYWGVQPDWAVYSWLLFKSIVFSWFGFVWFQKTPKGFADVL
jgi:lipopolysaccharide transport system permease protein